MKAVFTGSSREYRQRAVQKKREAYLPKRKRRASLFGVPYSVLALFAIFSWKFTTRCSYSESI